MRIVLGYPYSELCGVAKIGIRFEDATDKALPIRLTVNGAPIPLTFDAEFLQAHDTVYFGFNTYRITARPTDIVDIVLLSERGIEDRLRMVSANDERLWNSICTEMRRLPLLVPMPVDSTFYDVLGQQEFDTNFPESYARDGVLVIEDFFDAALMDRAAAELDAYCAAGYMGYKEGSSERVKQLHTKGGAISRIFRHRGLRARLEAIYGVEMVPCQTLAYRYGSQQGPHSDFVHLTAYPQNLMCGVWIAFEDVRPGAGELSYFLGSHKEKRLTMKDFGLPKVQNDNYSAFKGTFDEVWGGAALRHEEGRGLIKKGSVLIWDGNLIHGGNPRLDATLTRKSVVLHYFAKGAACYYDATGDIGFAGELAAG